MRTYAAETTVKSKSLVIDSINVCLLTKDEMAAFLSVEDEKLQTELDIWVGKKTLVERNNPKKRVTRGTLASFVTWVAGKMLFRSLNKRASSLNWSGHKVTKQYQKNGNFETAVNDLRCLKPNNIKTFKGIKGLKGIQGTVGNGRWTVKARSQSSGKGSPTLDIYRTSKLHRKVLRKIRYNKNKR